jgi:ATP-dependent helicase/nuclease subunit A
VLEQTAAAEGLDYDGATARLREWVTDPVQLDPPHPVGAEAIQVLTVHQAKGLEFPVVVLWDGRGEWDLRLAPEPWRMERDGRGWTMSLDGLAWEEPPSLELTQTEREYQRAERRRVIYVAATRPRDLLVIPRTGVPKPGKMVCADLLGGAETGAVHVLETYRPGGHAAWARQVSTPERRIPGDATTVISEIAGRWQVAAQDSARPRFKPVAVSEARATLTEREHVEEPARRKPREGRFGPLFGSAVHQAIGLLLRDPALGPPEAGRRAAALVGLTEHLDEAVADVGRAWQTLQAEGLVRSPGPDLQLEYPVAALWAGGTVLMGYVDLVSAGTDQLDILDFKTDAPPAEFLEAAYPEYVNQVQLYARLLEDGFSDRRLRLGLLFTADGGIRWVDPIGVAH